ncbi:TTF-type domain-containing protein [Citrus sinensis]|uniref:TTF-type domain-containing protein n=1 Tax=Citrus sinensis TaxID=2711 RepID=A0ACB8M197_CITSI|nr:TTF-type domain-containing protein [Citrus sinensis]
MDKSWVHCTKLSSEYEDVIEEFMKFAIGNSEGSSVIKCSCTKCMNLSFHTHKVVREHLYFHGFDVSYTTWSWHGEDVKDTPLPNVDVNVPFEFIDYNDSNTVDMVNDAYRDYVADPKAFKELLEQAEKPLYPGCTNFTKLGTLVSLFNIKGKFGWFDTSFTELLGLLAKMLPESNEILVSIWKKKDGSVDQYRKWVLAKEAYLEDDYRDLFADNANLAYPEDEDDIDGAEMDGVEFDGGDNDGADLDRGDFDCAEMDGVNFVRPDVDIPESSNSRRGDKATELASFIRVLARTSVSILYSDWHKVPLETKERLWKFVLMLEVLLSHIIWSMMTVNEMYIREVSCEEEEMDFGQRDKHPKVSTLRKKEEVRKKEEIPKNTTATIPIKSAKNYDSENNSERDAHKEVDNLGKPPANAAVAFPVQSTKNEGSEGDAHKELDNLGKPPKNTTAAILRKSPRLNPSISKDYANDERKIVGSNKKQLDFDCVDGIAEGIQEMHSDSPTKKPLLKKDKAKKVVVQPMRNTRSAVFKHQNSHPMLQLFGKLCEKYLPDENDGVLTYMIDDNVFQRHACAYIEKKDCNELLSMQSLGVNTIQAPKQNIAKLECGYYVLRYMKEIIADVSLLMNNFNGKKVCTQDELDEVRLEWANHFSDILVASAKCLLPLLNTQSPALELTPSRCLMSDAEPLPQGPHPQAESLTTEPTPNAQSLDAALAKQACAFRGHDESVNSRNRGNFIELIKHSAECSKEIAQVVLENAPSYAKYTSSDIQKELLNILANKVRNKICKELGDGKFCILVDKALDESNKEQMAIVLRYVDCDGYIRERFFEVVNVMETTAVTLKKEICNVLARYDLLVENIRGQGCMAFLLVLGSIVNVLTSSAKRLSELKYVCEAEIIDLIASGEVQTGTGANQIHTLQRPGATRWSSHFRSVSRLLDLFSVVRKVLRKLVECGPNNIIRGEAKVSTTKKLLQRLRDNGWETFIENVVIFCEKNEIDMPGMKARHMKGRGRSCQQNDYITVEHYYHYNIFNVVIDFQLMELNNRFT